MDDETKIAEIKAEMIALRKRADELERALQLLFGEKEDITFKPRVKEKQDIVSSIPTLFGSQKSLRGTFYQKVKQILEASKELKGKQIHSYFETMPYNSFSAQLSTLVKNGKIKKRVVANASNSDKYFYYL